MKQSPNTKFLALLFGTAQSSNPDDFFEVYDRENESDAIPLVKENKSQERPK